MNKHYCSNCNRQREYKIKENFINIYKGTVLDVVENIPVCIHCGEEIFVKEIEENNLTRLYDAYRSKNNLITPDELKIFRDLYDISQRELTAILSFGKMTINRYEKGAIPSKSNSDYLKSLINSQELFKELVEEAFLNERIKIKTKDKIVNKIKHNKEDEIKKIIINQLTHSPSEYNGYRKFDFEKTENIISYLASKVNLTKTSLNKYLFYIDFYNFKKYLRSMTGIQFIQAKYGPVVENHNYNLLLDISDKYYIDEIEEGEYSRVTIMSNDNYNLDKISDKERNIIDEVIYKFKNYTVNKISELSHEEKAWKETPRGNLISYEYAQDLKLF